MDRLVSLGRALLADPTSRGAVGAFASAAAVGSVTGLVYLLRPFVPVFGLGELYVLAVLPIAVLWGRMHAVVVAIVSMLVFNYLFLPPVLTFTLSGEENWVTLSLFLVTGLLVAALASRARDRAREAERREREAALLAEVSTVLLSGATVEAELARIAEGTARVLAAPGARIEVGPGRPRPGERPVELRTRRRAVGTLYLPAGVVFDAGAAARFLPALGSLLAVATDREELAREALEAEALRRSDSIKPALLRAVSHDLRSPLTAIRVAVESLASPALVLEPADRTALLETVRSEAQRLDRLVGNLLDLSRLQADAAQPQRALRSLDGLVVQALAGLAGHERVEISIPGDLPLVDLDAAQIERALVNLIENALKFSPAASPVRVTAVSAGGHVLVRIDDEGPGIPAAELERIFEPFRHASTAADRKGAGLGLAIARGFAEANGGHVRGEPRPGGGSSFVLTLPVAAVRESA